MPVASKVAKGLRARGIKSILSISQEVIKEKGLARIAERRRERKAIKILKIPLR